MNSRRAVFLDRDGVLNRPVVKNGKPFPPACVAEFEIYPEAFAALTTLRELGFHLFVVTNQPDVARGTQQRSAIEDMHSVLRDRLQLNDFYVCYHDDVDCCGCRKPQAGLLLNAAAEHGLSLKDSYMIGDRWRDVDCGAAASCRTIFIDRGYSEKLRAKPDYTVADLGAAAALIAARGDK